MAMTIAEARDYLAAEYGKVEPDSLYGHLLAEALEEGGIDMGRPRGQWMVALLGDLGLSRVAPTSIRYGRPIAGKSVVGLRRLARAWGRYRAAI